MAKAREIRHSVLLTAPPETCEVLPPKALLLELAVLQQGELSLPITRAASGAKGKRAGPQKEKEDMEERGKNNSTPSRAGLNGNECRSEVAHHHLTGAAPTPATDTLGEEGVCGNGRNPLLEKQLQKL